MSASSGNSKAMIAAIFLQYCGYSVFYLLDELTKISQPHYRALIKEQEGEMNIGALSKFTDRPKKEDPPVRKGSDKRRGTGHPKKDKKKARHDDEQYEGGKKGKPEIQSPEETSSPEKSEASPQKPNALKEKLKNNPKLRAMTDDEINAYAEWEENRLVSISNQIVEYFPSVMMFHTIIVSIVAVRAPTDFAVACTLFAMMMRLIQVFGFYCNKKSIYIAAGGVEAFINFILLFTAMGYSQKDFEALLNK